MPPGAVIADVADVPADGSYLFTAEDPFTNETELILVRCDDDPGVRAWHNTCTHESQRFDRGDGAAIRDGELVCPRHGSLFDTCSGDCDNGPAAGTELPSVEVAVADGQVYLADDKYTYLHDGGIKDEEPGSSSHLSF
ncbi:MAG: Rieske (2Fe-2S) protein [Halobacteriaceae archaeon]